jgi:hypothetical protein
LLAGEPQQAIYALHFALGHRGNLAGGKQLVPDATAGDRLRGFGLGAHCLDQVERLLRHAATTLFGTCSKILGHDTLAAMRARM